nr:putative ribonuclease H-like domain-containing protein [Tanacetum cinerariifolium]
MAFVSFNSANSTSSTNEADYTTYGVSIAYTQGSQSVEERLAHYKKNVVVFEEKINILNLKVKVRDNALVENTKKLEKAEKEKDELKLTLEKFQNSSKSLNNWKVKLDKGYHAVPSPYIGNYIPPQPNLTFIYEQVKSDYVDVVSNVASSDVKTVESKHKSGYVKNKEFKPKVKVKTVRSSIEKIKIVKPARKKVKKETNDLSLIMKIMMVDSFSLEMVKAEFLVKNGIAKKKNKKLIEAARTMALVIKPHNKTPYELIHGRPLLIDFMKPFGCSITILNTRDHLGEFDGKAYKGIFVGYSVVSKAMRVFNKRTRIVEETLNIRFLKNEPNVKGNGPDWLFNIDSLTISINYEPVVTGKQTNGIVGTKDNIVVSQAKKKKEPKQEYIMIPICTTNPLISQGPKDSAVDAGKKATEVDESRVLDNGRQDDQVTKSEFEGILQQERTPASTNVFEEHPFEQFSLFKNAFSLPHFPIVTPINNTGIFGNAYDDEAMEEEVDINNVVSYYTIPDAPLTKFLKDHHKDQTASTPMKPNKALVKDAEAEDTIVANSTTEAEYVAAVNCYRQVLWIQNQMLDYGFNFLNTKIYIDNESKIYIVKNPVFHSKIKHIEIRHHFIRDSYEKKLIQVIKIHTDQNVANLLSKAFDVSRFNVLIASIGLLNL